MQIILTISFFLWLQISEVVNSMKDLISYERKTRLGPLRMLLYHTVQSFVVLNQFYLLGNMSEGYLPFPGQFTAS